MREMALNFWNLYSHVLPDLGRQLFTVVLIVMGGKFISLAAGRMINNAIKGKLKMDDNLGRLLYMILNYGIIIVCAIMILEIFGFNPTSLIALVGTAGLAIGLALKDTLSNVASGVILIFLHPFYKGDFIEFGSTLGRVKELGLFVTILETPDGIYISVPNSNLWGPPLKNYSRNEKRRMDLSIMISYDDPLDTAFGVMEKIAREEPRFLLDPAPQVVVQSVG